MNIEEFEKLNITPMDLILVKPVRDTHYIKLAGSAYIGDDKQIKVSMFPGDSIRHWLHLAEIDSIEIITKSFWSNDDE